MVYLLDVALPRPVKNQRQENVPTHMFTPRTYQVEVLDLAIKRNTIVCLNSSSNRTFLSVLLIKELAYQVRSKSPCIGFPSVQEPGKSQPDQDGECCPTVSESPKERNMTCTICLINSSVQTEELMKMVHRHTDLRVLEIKESGEILTSDQWSDFLSSHSVILMSGKTLVHALQSGYCKMSWINLLIFDDCHLAMDTAHPYHQVMALYQSCPAESQPRILGLTYSILQSPCSTPQELEDYLTKLEQSLCSVAETATDVGELDFYGAKPAEHVANCPSLKDKFGLREEIESIICSAVMFLDEGTWPVESEGGTNPKELCLNILTEVYNVLLLLGSWSAGFVAQAMSKQLGKQEDLSFNEEGERLVRFCHSKLKMIYLLVERFYEKEVQDIEDFLALMSPKVLELIEILHGYKPDDNFMIIGDDFMEIDDDDGEDTDDSFDLSEDEDCDDKDDESKNKANVHYVAVKRINSEADTKEKEENNLCGLVFVNRPHTALALNKLLQELCNWDSDLFFLQPHHLTWSDSLLTSAELKQCKEMSMMHRRQEETLRKFRNREVNLLVAWSSLQDGVDLPRCNLVICFDLPEDYRAYVYSKGKARAQKAQFHMLVDDATESDFGKNLDVIKGIENILATKCQHYEPVEELTEADKERVDLCITPYAPCPEDSNAVKVTMSNGIGLVNRYCAKLPSDAFTHLTPQCLIEECHGEDGVTRYKAVLQLPINSPIKQPIVGDTMESSQLAKMAVAMKTCVILHKQGELDNNLLPVGKEMVKYEDEEAEWEEHEAQGQARPGTTKRKQYYNKKIAQPLLGRPLDEKKCFLYTIKMVLTCPITEEQNTRGRKIHAPEDTPRMFGIISEKLIPLVPQFPVFTRSGEVTASIDLVCDDLILSKEKLDRLVTFHHLVFAKVLRLEKDPMRFDFSSAESSYVIIPLSKGETDEIIIDWDFVKVVEDNPVTERQVQITKNGKEKENVKKRPMFVFDETKFEDAVVMPSYRNIDQPQYFYVAEIRRDLTPKSPFPSPELYETFQKYYSSKYGLEITNIKQPLLDVDHTSARLNLLTPRYMNQKGVALPTSSAETRRARRENLQQKQILVPELCDVHPFPASLWRKAVCLPAILYRVNCLLIADELRMTIADGARIGVVHLSPDFRFPQLEFGFSTKPSDLIKSGTDEEENAEKEGDDNLDDSKTSDEQDGEDVTSASQTETEHANHENAAKTEITEGVDDSKNEQVSPVEDSPESPTEKAEKPKGRKRNRKSKSKKAAAQANNADKSVEAENSPVNAIEDEINCDKVDTITEKVQEMNLNAKNSVKLSSNGIIKDISSKSADINGDKVRKNIDDVLPESNIKPEQNKDNEKWELDMTSLQQDQMMQQINKMMSGVNVEEESGVKITELPDDADETNLAEEFNGKDPWLGDDPYEENETSNDPDEKPTIVYKPLNDMLNIDTQWSGTSGKPQDPLLSTPKSTSSYNTAEESLSPGSFCSLSPAQTPKKSPRKDVLPKPEQVKMEPARNIDEDGNLIVGFWNKEESEEEEEEEISIVTSVCDTDKPISETAGHDDHISHEEGADNSNSVSGKSKPDKSTNGSKGRSKQSKDWNDSSKVIAVSSYKGSLVHKKDGRLSFVPSFLSNQENQDDTVVADAVDKDCHLSVRFDEECDLKNFVGPSPCTILQTLTMSNANDFFNLERQETIGDSFLKFAITVYLYCSYPGIHEGKLSYLRSKQVSNYNLYKLGKRKQFPECMVASKFEPTENWLPPGYVIKKNNAYKGLSVLMALAANMEKEKEKAEQQGKVAENTDASTSLSSATHDEQDSEDPDQPHSKTTDSHSTESEQGSSSKIETKEEGVNKSDAQSQVSQDGSISLKHGPLKSHDDKSITEDSNELSSQLPSQSSVSDDPKNQPIESCSSISTNDLETSPAVPDSQSQESLVPVKIKAGNGSQENLTEEALFFEELEAALEEEETEKEEVEGDLQCVIPYNLQTQHSLPDKSIADCVEALIGCYLTTCGHRAALQFMSWLGLKVLPQPKRDDADRVKKAVPGYGYLVSPPSPLLSHVENAADVLQHHLDGYDAFEEQIQYKFKDKSYLLQAFTHASYHYNTVTDCYQRLEFLGDAILDYVITRHLYEDSKKHSPGILTDLRSALVNNNIFAALAVKWDFHKYFKAVSPQLFTVIEKFVAWQKDKGDEIDLDEEFEEDEEGEAHQEREDIEIPKALGDIFESVAGAIYLDSGMSLDTVWQVYYRLMKPQIDAFTSKIPKSPVRELLEMEPETAKFEKPERTLDGKIRVTVNVVGKGRFHGVGRNYRIAKSAAAKRALKFIRMMQQQIDMYEMALGAQEMAFGKPENMLPFGGPESMMNFIDYDQ